MYRTITVRLKDEDYQKIALASRHEHRPISNLMTFMTLMQIEKSGLVDAVEMSQIIEDKRLSERLKRGHREAKQFKGKFVG